VGPGSASGSGKSWGYVVEGLDSDEEVGDAAFGAGAEESVAAFFSSLSAFFRASEG